MTLDHKWIADYFEKEIARLRKIEEGAKKQEEDTLGEIAKFTHLISLETNRDAEYQRSKRIAEKTLEHPKSVLENVTPKLNKMSEQWAILNSLIV